MFALGDCDSLSCCVTLEIEHCRLLHVHGNRARSKHDEEKAAPDFSYRLNRNFRSGEVERNNANVHLLRRLADLAVE